jgi:PPOX class probable F420-dependent enzyme
MASLLDLTKERDAHIQQRLQNDLVIWLNSVRPDGRPHSVIVWYLWDNDAILIFSRTPNQKVRNIRNNANVVLAFDNSNGGSDPITIEGTATLLAPGEIDTTYPAYVAKYGGPMKGIGYTPEQMAADYSQAIRIVPTRIG